MTNPLRFAPIIRVSTEQQASKGESLRAQTEQIKTCVELLGGVIPERCWQYCGSEHATPGYERKLLAQLLADAEKDVFDAVIVCDMSRWSRDNSQSKKGLEILRENDIRFFALTSEYDLYSAENCFFIGMGTECNEFHAKNQKAKSSQSRITRAKRGVPATGKLPYGRTFDRSKEGYADSGMHLGWGLDREKVKKIEYAAEKYLNGEHLSVIAKTLGMNAPNLWKVLTRRSGNAWEQTFVLPNRSKKEQPIIVGTRIPRLLPEEVIKKIHARAQANKTYTHGEIKHQYLLSRMVFCANCGLALFGQLNHNKKRYYRHSRNGNCPKPFWVPADELEISVLAQVFAALGDLPSLKKAIEQAIPNKEKVRALEQKRDAATKSLKQTEASKNRLIELAAKDILTDQEIAVKMGAIRERERLLRDEVDSLTHQLQGIPEREKSELVARVIINATRRTYGEPSRLVKMDYAQRRKLLETFFAGKTPDGKRCGVYVTKPDASKAQWRYVIRGNLPAIAPGGVTASIRPLDEAHGGVSIEGLLPLSEDELHLLLGITEPEQKRDRAAVTKNALGSVTAEHRRAEPRSFCASCTCYTLPQKFHTLGLTR